MQNVKSGQTLAMLYNKTKRMVILLFASISIDIIFLIYILDNYISTMFKTFPNIPASSSITDLYALDCCLRVQGR